MSYLSRYEGQLKFAAPLDIEQLLYLSLLSGKDIRTDPTLAPVLAGVDPNKELTFLDFVISADWSALEVYSNADGRSTGEPVATLFNFITQQMRTKWPDFRLKGHLDAVTVEGGLFRVKILDDGTATEVEMKAVEA